MPSFEAIKLMSAIAMGDRPRYRALDRDGKVLVEGELGPPVRTTDGDIKWELDIPSFEGEAVRLMYDSLVLGESEEHEIRPFRGDMPCATNVLSVWSWLTEEEPADIPKWASAGS